MQNSFLIVFLDLGYFESLIEALRREKLEFSLLVTSSVPRILLPQLVFIFLIRMSTDISRKHHQTKERFGLVSLDSDAAICFQLHVP